MPGSRLRCSRSFCVVFVAILVVVLLPSCKKKVGPQIGEESPGFTLPDLNGVVHGLSSLRGRVVVLNYWATWCPPCIDEMPSLEKLHKALDSKGLSVIGVSVDERYTDVVEFVDSLDLTFTILHDEGMKVSRSYQTFRYPETFIIGRDGRLKSKVVGSRDWIAPSVIRDLVELLNEEQSSN